VRPVGATARLVALTGGIGLLLASAFAFIDPGQTVRSMRERVFDQLLASFPRGETADGVVVVDVGRDALATYGPWPWPREQLARLIDKIAEAKPKALAIDILLAEREGDASGDERLATAIARIPTALAIVLDPAPSLGTPGSTSVAVTGDVAVPDLIVTPGIGLPAPILAEKAQGLGIVSLPTPEGEPVRAVPLLAGGAGVVFAGLAAETLRVAEGGTTIIAAAPPQVLRIGEHSVPLPPDGLMRLHFVAGTERSAHTIAAEALLKGKSGSASLAGKIVFLGASAPEAGGLRLTAADPFMPSVEIQAEALEQMITGHVPVRAMDRIEIAAGIGLGVIGIIAVIFLPPGAAVVTVSTFLFAWIAAAVGLTIKALWLTDPITPAIIALLAVQGAGLAQFGATYRQRLAIERRFALHLPPEVVRRIAANPSEIKLAGETRVITALFTDIEGFTALTERVGPEAVVALVDRYVDIVAGIIVAHGGMVDKIVGDAVHALFNAPLDLAGHAERAVACAVAIVEATEQLRRDPDIAASELGRTRIGIETGSAILGDVGRGAKRDYTAYGRAVNIAARLEEANKEFGSWIALGPGTAAALGGTVPLRLLGKRKLRGIEDEIEIFEPVFEKAAPGVTNAKAC
jgi:adenylate cyclase